MGRPERPRPTTLTLSMPGVFMARVLFTRSGRVVVAEVQAPDGVCVSVEQEGRNPCVAFAGRASAAGRAASRARRREAREDGAVRDRGAAVVVAPGSTPRIGPPIRRTS